MNILNAKNEDGWKKITENYFQVVQSLKNLGFERTQFRHIRRSGITCWINAGKNKGEKNGDEIVISNKNGVYKVIFRTIENGKKKYENEHFMEFKHQEDIFKEIRVLNWLQKGALSDEYLSNR